jgi:hypothetical protein
MKRYDTPTRMPAFGIAAALASGIVFVLAVYLPMNVTPSVQDVPVIAAGKNESLRKVRVPHVEIIGVRTMPTASVAAPASTPNT